MSDHDVRWAEVPAEHDFPAAFEFLSLLNSEEDTDRLVTRLRAAPTTHRKAKDLLRASGLDLVSADDPHVAADLERISAGETMSPVLVVVGDMNRGVSAQIADGFHRICASHHVDPNVEVACRLVMPLDSRSVLDAENMPPLNPA